MSNTIPAVERHSAALVVGLGATGLSVVRYLHQLGLAVRVVDSRMNPPGLAELQAEFPEISVHLGDFDINPIEPLLVVSPGVPVSEPVLQAAKKNGAQIVGDIELFFQRNQQPVIAITGSNGKSTVTTLVGKMCSAAGLKPLIAGNIGYPVLQALTDKREYDVAVLELSSFQLETTSQVPAEAAAILNISADHMDRYPSMGDYILAKARILRGAKRAVLPLHDDALQQITNVAERYSFALQAPSNDHEFGVVKGKKHRWLMRGDQRLMKLRDIPMTGMHNVLNVLSAFALVDCLKLPLSNLVAAVKSFTGLPHRMQTVAREQGVTWVNDSKATNIGATSTALSSVKSELIWIAGGQGKGADFTQLRAALGEHVKCLIVFGEDADEIESALAGHLPVYRVQDMAEAVSTAAHQASKDCIVLLSPACASFDMFESFEHRGQVFIDCVQNHLAKGAA